MMRKDSSEAWVLCDQFESACAVDHNHRHNHQPRTIDGTIDAALGGAVGGAVGGRAEGRVEGAVHEDEAGMLSSVGALVAPQYDPLDGSTVMSSSVGSENTCSTGLSSSPTEGGGGEGGALPSGGHDVDDPYGESRPTSAQSLDDEWGWHVEFS